jgi:eukaryotic-like serine/threonine-protein kinase
VPQIEARKGLWGRYAGAAKPASRLYADREPKYGVAACCLTRTRTRAQVLTIENLQASLPADIQVRGEIHQGGQRYVYDVRVEGEHRVLKLMPEAARARAEREVSIGRRFDHPNLSRIADEELQELEIDGVTFVYFTEQFIDGETLAERTEPMTPCDALSLAGALVSAVTYLWEHHHVVHRDIKPLNIMVKPDATFVLLDIGVARHQDLTTLTVFAGEHQPGTIGYLAPEQLAPLKGREIDYRADLFAIGIVMYQQLTGHLPFDPSSASYRTLLATGIAPDVEDVPPTVGLLLSRLLAPRPHGRFRLDRAAEAVNQAREELGCS